MLAGSAQASGKDLPAIVEAGVQRPLINEQLVDAVRRKRVVPFIGAGFSTVAGFPGWIGLLEKIYERLEGNEIPFSEIKKSCGSDPLRIAEYLYLLAGETVGPLRHRMESALATPDDFASSAHIELANLALPIVYTTNFDELIEETFRLLDIPHSVTVTVRDLAIEKAEGTRIVKYHGDLQHDESLVLTEKTFYDRLEFESPLDIKFRSDLLGKGALFIGYGFGDINVRVIWHKLARLMSGVPADERPPSFMVRLDTDPVLERLDRSVGLTTVALDPTAAPKNAAQKTCLLEKFLLDLSLAVTDQGALEDASRPPACSPRMLSEAIDLLSKAEVQPLDGRDDQLLRAVGSRRLMGLVRPLAEQLLEAYSNADLYGDGANYRAEYALNFSLSYPAEAGEEAVNV